MRACPEKSLSDWMRATMAAKRIRRRKLAALPIDASPLRREVQSHAVESVKVFPRPGRR